MGMEEELPADNAALYQGTGSAYWPWAVNLRAVLNRGPQTVNSIK